MSFLSITLPQIAFKYADFLNLLNLYIFMNIPTYFIEAYLKIYFPSFITKTYDIISNLPIGN